MKKIVAMLLCATMILGLTACGSKAEESKKEEKASGNSKLEEVNVVLDWYPNAIHAFLYDAIDKGYFKEEGLDVHIITPAESVDALSFVSSNKAQIGLTYPIEVIKSATTDMKIHAIGAVTQNCLCVFTTLKENNITKDLSTLKGKKIGYDGSAASEAMVKSATKYAGLKESDYELVNVGYDLTTALTTKSVDFTAGMMVNDEVVTLKNSGYNVETFNYSDYGIPELYDIVMVANDEKFKKDKKMYQGFLRACYKGFQDVKASEDDTMDIIMNEMNSDENPLDEAQQRESYETLLPSMETKDAKFLSMTEERWQIIIDWMRECGLIDKKVAPSDIMTSPEIDVE
ncbi:MAG: ABC transporter substrate-binding protein [Lachnospiraceae bacterium]|nr:ABC transporter substrate-binding protein [Lachnospiraceae bacterium]